jgi:hypothetical protein
MVWASRTGETDEGREGRVMDLKFQQDEAMKRVAVVDSMDYERKVQRGLNDVGGEMQLDVVQVRKMRYSSV